MTALGEPESSQSALRVFLSYAREDVDFAQEVRLALADKGFDPLIDLHSIDAGEKWMDRLSAMISGADVVVFVLTKSSGASSTCAWEVREAQRLAKRILVLVPGPVPSDLPRPPELQEIQWIHCYRDPTIPGSSFIDGLLRLDRAIRVNTTWLREHTRLYERATEWKRSQDEGRLLRGSALSEAQAWLGATPPATKVTTNVVEFLDASESAERQRESERTAQLAAREEAVRATEQAQAEKQAALQMMDAALRRRDEALAEFEAERQKRIEAEYETKEQQRLYAELQLKKGEKSRELLFPFALTLAIVSAGFFVIESALVFAPKEFHETPLFDALDALIPKPLQTLWMWIGIAAMMIASGFAVDKLRPQATESLTKSSLQFEQSKTLTNSTTHEPNHAFDTLGDSRIVRYMLERHAKSSGTISTIAFGAWVFGTLVLVFCTLAILFEETIRSIPFLQFVAAFSGTQLQYLAATSLVVSSTLFVVYLRFRQEQRKHTILLMMAADGGAEDAAALILADSPTSPRFVDKII